MRFSGIASQLVAAAVMVVMASHGLADRHANDLADDEVVSWAGGAALCPDAGGMDQAPVCDGQHCANCHVGVPVSVNFIDLDGASVPVWHSVRRLQVDGQPRLKPPRLS